MIEPGDVTPSERRWVLTWGLVALAITCVPYLLGRSLETPERVFGGCILLIDDCYSYLAKMRMGAQGAWLFHIPYTSEPHSTALLYTFYLLVGKLATLLPGGDLATRVVWVYHGARWVCGLALLATVYRFLAAFTRRVEVRRLAWLLVTCGGGLGWLLVAVGKSNWLGTPPLDFYLPEGFALLALYGFPHVAAAQSLLLGGFLCLLKAWERHRANLKWAALAGFLWLAMGLIVPFYVGVAWAVMGAAWVALGVRRRRVCWRQGWLAGLAVALSAPIVAYSGWVFTTDGVYRTWAAQNRILSPHPLHYLAAYGVPLALACFAARDAWCGDGPGWLALVWVAIVPVLVYLPFNLQRRLVVGVQVPLSLLAAWGAVKLWRRGRRWLVGALVATMVPTACLLLLGGSAWMLSRPALVFRDGGEIAAMDWLEGRIQPAEVVLTAYDTGNYLPVRVPARVFLGHGFETVDFEQKEALVKRFFSVTTGDVWRRQLLAEHGVDYIVWGPAERALGDFEPHTAPYLRQVYEAAGYVVFEVKQ